MAVYKESQHLAPAIRWLSAGLALIVVAGALVATVRTPTGDVFLSLLVPILAGLLALAMVLSLRLDLRVTDLGLTYRLHPLEWKEKTLLWSEVETMEWRPVNWKDGYGGFGRRRRLLRREIAYILNRRSRLLIRLKDGRIRTFTPASPEKLERFLRQLSVNLPVQQGGPDAALPGNRDSG